MNWPVASEEERLIAGDSTRLDDDDDDLEIYLIFVFLNSIMIMSPDQTRPGQARLA